MGRFDQKGGIELKGWKFGAFIGAFVGAIGLALYPIVIYPMMHPEYYQEIQRKARAQMDLSRTQPGALKPWTDPFDRKKEE